MIQHNDFWDLVSQKVNIYRADLSGTNQASVILHDGTEVPTDALLCGTGWDTGYPFFTPKQLLELGLPHDPHQDSDEDSKAADQMSFLHSGYQNFDRIRKVFKVWRSFLLAQGYSCYSECGALRELRSR